MSPGTQPGLRVVAGTDLDFASYVAARRPALLRWAWSVCGDAHTAEDLLQVSLVRVLAQWDSLRDHGAADAYVRRTITRQNVSRHRQRWVHDEISTSALPERTTAPATESDTGGLWPLVQALPAQQRAAVALRYYEELSIAETAAVLGCSPGTVKSNTSRGLAALRRLAAETELAG